MKLGYNEQTFGPIWSFYYINQDGYNKPQLAGHELFFITKFGDNLKNK